MEINLQEMKTICQLAQTAGPSQIKQLSQEERKVLSLMLKALGKGKDGMKTDLGVDLETLKSKLSTPDIQRSGTRGQRISKGIQNVVGGRMGSDQLSLDISKANPLNKTQEQVRQQQIAFHRQIVNDLEGKADKQRDRLESFLHILHIYHAIEASPTPDEIKRLRDEIILPKNPLKDPVHEERVKLFRECRTNLEYLLNSSPSDRKKVLETLISDMNKRHNELIEQHGKWRQIVRQENQMIRDLEDRKA